MYLYLVVSKDTSLQTNLQNIICIRHSVEEARKDMETCRTLYQFDMVNQTFTKVLP